MFQTLDHLHPYKLENYDIETLQINSEVLASNPLQDPSTRYNPVLVPREKKEGLPVVLVLAGFTGNGPNYFNIKSFAENMIQTIDRCTTLGQAPEALYVFVDAVTFWGGAQFLNSPHTGRYEDYVVGEVVTAVKETYSTNTDQWAVCGGSSGGYGALHLGSAYPDIFSYVGALAPDSAFEVTLLPDIYKSLLSINKLGGVKGVRRELKSGRLLKNKKWHDILNAVGMASCYSPEAEGPFDFFLPVDEKGKIIESVWRVWKEKDPVSFLARRQEGVEELKGLYLSVGIYDQFQLYFGARQICEILESYNLNFDYSEFEGSHFELGQRRPHMWLWLKRQWSVE